MIMSKSVKRERTKQALQESAQAMAKFFDYLEWAKEWKSLDEDEIAKIVLNESKKHTRTVKITFGNDFYEFMRNRPTYVKIDGDYIDLAGRPLEDFVNERDGITGVYEIEKNRVATAQDLVSFIRHLVDKNWITKHHIKELINASPVDVWKPE